MHLDSFSNPVVIRAFWIGIWLSVFVVFLLLLTSILRFQLSERNKQKRLILSYWQPWLTKSLVEGPGVLPPIRHIDERVVLQILSYYYQLLSGGLRTRINELASAVGCPRIARKYLRSRSVEDKLLSMHMLGHLRDRSSWRDLMKLVGDKDPVVSLAAARAMTQIYPDVAMGWVAPLIVERSDWAKDKVGHMLKEAGSDAVSKPLADAVSEAPPEHLPRLISYLQFAHQDHARPLLHKFFQAHTDKAPVLSEGLRQFGAFGNSQDLLSVRAHLHHPDSSVRIQAVNALKSMGTPEDERELANLLRDHEPSVRYHAAHALITLPFMTQDRLQKLIEEHTDHKGAGALVQAMAENNMQGGVLP